MPHCPVCNIEADDVMDHTKEEAEKGDDKHKQAMEMENK